MCAQTDISWIRQIVYEYVGTPHQSQFDTLEMRGDQIKDGFRSKN